MIKIRLLSPGKIKENWLEEALQEYTKRLAPHASFEYLWSKDEKQFVKQLTQEKRLICLDPKGKEMTSEAFATFFFREIEAGGSSVSLAIGGPDGLPDKVKAAWPLLSLSKMTFTHQMVRLILVEQIFRAFEIRRGSDYHR
jgi:23S rRNA (pseudouridine1915-N3)-methyltransferase